jgi:hypothetical protein
MKVDPADAREFAIGLDGQARRCSAARGKWMRGFFDRETACRIAVTVLACDSFFVRLRAVSPSPPSFFVAAARAGGQAKAEQTQETRTSN